MDPGVGIILFGGAVLATVLVLISHANGQAKLDRQKKERAQLEAEADELEQACIREDERDERRKERYRKERAEEALMLGKRKVAEEEADRKRLTKRARIKHQKTRNVLRQAAEKRKARRLYPAGVVK